MPTTLPVAIAVQRARRPRPKAQLQVSYDQIRNLGRSLLSAQENERAHFARELHDDISQQMVVLHTELQLLAGREDATQLRRELQELAARTLAVTRSLHDLSHRLHPAYLRLVGLTTALERLRRELSTGEVAIEFSHDSVPASVGPDVKLCLFRVAQEALSNAMRHSGADRVVVWVGGGPDIIRMTIEDNGSGFDREAARNGLGLISMSERVEQIGGTLQVRSRPGHGTRLEVRVPWVEGSTAAAEAAS